MHWVGLLLALAPGHAGHRVASTPPCWKGLKRSWAQQQQPVLAPPAREVGVGDPDLAAPAPAVLLSAYLADLGGCRSGGASATDWQ